jgi:ubiquinone/menaquinone biosynthesis C-methylase UbiE
MDEKKPTEYPAREVFKFTKMASEYDSARFAGVLNKLVWHAEKKAIKRLCEEMPANYRILDIPAGTARLWEPMVNHFAKVVGVDISEAMLSHAKARYGQAPNVSFTVADAAHLPFADKEYDLALSVRFFGHLPWDVSVSVLREMGRVCKDGMAVVMYLRSPVYVMREWFQRHFRPIGYPWHTLTGEQMQQMFDEAGLRILWQRPLFPMVSQGVLVRAVSGRK